MPPLCQVASSVTNLRRTHAWYRDVVGFRPAGGTNLFFGPLAARVQGLPRAASTCWWLVDRQEFFQLELFEFRRPPARPMPPDRRPCDIGYTTLGVHVADLDAAVERAQRAGSPPPGDAVGAAAARRVCVRDPDGVLVELMEDDPRTSPHRGRPRPGVPAAARSVTLSVANLERSRRFFVDSLGLGATDGLELHRPEHEAMWGLEGAGRESVVLSAEDFLVELVQYSEPAGRSWPSGYKISDQGLLNVAFGFRTRRELNAVYRSCRAAGHRGNSRPLTFGPWSVVYVNDDQGFSVELLHVAPWYRRWMGFRPRATPRIAPFLR